MPPDTLLGWGVRGLPKRRSTLGMRWAPGERGVHYGALGFPGTAEPVEPERGTTIHPGPFRGLVWWWTRAQHPRSLAPAWWESM